MAVLEQSVNLGEVKYSQNEDVLVCYGLGSCVGVVIYDSYTKIAAMGHVVLPTNSKGDQNTQATSYFAVDKSPARYADSGVWYLFENLLKKGAKKNNLKAKIAGGASVLAIPIFDKGSNAEIGQRNLSIVKKVLDEIKVPLVAEDVGGNKGRTMRFYNEDARVEISTVGAIKKLL